MGPDILVRRSPHYDRQSTNLTGSTVDSQDQALQIIAKIAGKESSTLERAMNLMVDLKIDSPQALELLVTLEDRLQIEISDEEAARMVTVGDVLDFVAGSSAQAAS